MTTVMEAPVEIREGDYGTKVASIEPGGAEFIPLGERHGNPIKLFSTWMSPNFEFATVFVGVLCIPAFGLTFWHGVIAIIIGTSLGSITQGILSARGPEYGVPQMVLSRISFGYWGNALPAGINALIAGIGWFAVNSVSGALALSTLFHWNDVLCLLIVVAVQLVVASLGHNLVHIYEAIAFPVLLVIFAIMAYYTFKHANYAHPKGGAGFGGFGGFTLAVAATFGYAVGWNPYASDYTRYFSPNVSKKAVALWSGLGVAISCIFLEIVGAASATISGVNGLSGPAPFVAAAPKDVADATLIAIAIGAVAANALNIYSGAMSFTTLGIHLPLKYRRAAIAGVFGTIGFFVAWSGLSDAGTKYNNFLLVIAYWIGPWLAVILIDQLIRPKDGLAEVLYDKKHTSWAGPIAMALGMAISILLFSDQTDFIGFVARHWDSATKYGIGDLTFEVGFVVSGITYLIGYSIENRRKAVVLPN